MTKATSFLFTIFLIATAVSMMLTVGDAAVVKGANSRFASATKPGATRTNTVQRGAASSNHYRRLHDLIEKLGDNPNEDIHTNIVLNMEGI